MIYYVEIEEGTEIEDTTIYDTTDTTDTTLYNLTTYPYDGTNVLYKRAYNVQLTFKYIMFTPELTDETSPRFTNLKYIIEDVVS